MHEEILLPQTKIVLEKINNNNLPENSFLFGGTGLALHLGHRRSVDLDFFTQTEFLETQWEKRLAKELNFKLITRDWQTLIGHIDSVKFSLFGYKHKLINPPVPYTKILVASLPDIAATKLEAVIGRSTKRDLIDLYFLAQKFTLKGLFKFYQEKYGNFSERELMIKKALVYFEEAEEDEMPDMLIKTNWNDIKRWFLKEIF